MATPRMPPPAELDRLARAYISMVDRSTAATAAPLYVSLAAAQEYLAAVEGFGRGDIEAARRDLAQLLVHARPTSDPMQYRARRPSSGLDIQARVVPDGELLVVVHVHVRNVNVRGRSK